MGFDEAIFLENLKSRPETIRTIVKEQYGPTTATIIAKRKTNTLFRFHCIYEYPLDGARTGVKLFFHPQKTYTIVIRRSRSGFETYYCKDVKHIADGVELLDCHLLDIQEWIPKGSLILRHDEVWRCF